MQRIWSITGNVKHDLICYSTSFPSVCLLCWKGMVGSAWAPPRIFWIERRMSGKSRSLFRMGFCCSAALPRWVWPPVYLLPAAKPACQHIWVMWAQQRVSTSQCSWALAWCWGRRECIWFSGVVSLTTDDLCEQAARRKDATRPHEQWCNIRCFAVGQWLDFGSEVRGKKN